ncbi:GntP family permease [Bradyrhizobium sp. Ash2021]|uniref:GntP family permease n=1 Tax=Bradyrhizobium sp. Ash2021 TaxID=2954771 RepID=UPI002814F884|nr:GntP family permease [Bradyrhizobium sp. Ash2021]WMT74487.1 GntP family permease [Bradyrhizobium sp. Ash2021]
MNLLIVLAALVFLMLVAYRGYSVILFAPVAALGAVLFTDPSLVPPMFSSVFMEKMVGFVKNYFPVFMLGAVFGKVIELSGFSKSIVSAVIGVLGRERAVLSIVVVCAILTYGGVSLFVVVFAVYPFAAEMFRQGDIPKRLIPCTVALGAFSFTMDALPGTPQIQNIIPTTFFNTTTWAAPVLGLVGSAFVLVVGLAYIENRRKAAQKRGEGYGTNLVNEPEPFDDKELPNPWIAVAPLVVVGVANLVLTLLIPRAYGSKYEITLGSQPIVTQIAPVAAIWAVEGALILGILTVFVFAWRPVLARFADGSKAAVAGALLASMNTAAEYGFGGVIALLPGFTAVSAVLKAIPNPLVNEAVTVTVLAGITGSASGGMSIALAAMSDDFISAAKAANISLEVFHRIAAMASGGMDTLPHNGAVITLLAVTGLTHRQAYKDVFVITLTKTAAVFVAIGFFYLTGIY